MKKTIGFYICPFPSFIKKENCNVKDDEFINSKNSFVYLLYSNIFKYLQKFKHLLNIDNYIIIPYNIDIKDIDKYLYEIDIFIVMGNLTSDYNVNNEINIIDKEHKQHFTNLRSFYFKILDINKNNRPLPILSVCYGYELFIKIIEKLNYTNNKFLTYNTFDKITNNTYLNKKYKDDYYKPKYSFNVIFNYENMDKTNYLKNEYEVISTLDINNIKRVEIFKHLQYSIFLTKISNLLEHSIIRKEFCKNIDLSFNYRKEKYKEIKVHYKFKPLKSKTVKCILTQTIKGDKKDTLKKNKQIFTIFKL